ncbi:rsph1 [Symbiodinium sp. CCMP2592]|nr:rsph1 [Symbiodinium sp. CCMP2592]
MQQNCVKLKMARDRDPVRDVSGDVEFFRRLGEDDEDDKDKKKKDEGPKDGGSVIVVIEWTDHQWEDFVKQAKKDGVKETDFPRLRKEIPCHHAPIKEVVPFLYLMHNLELIRRMMHTYTGTFLIMVFLVFGVGGGYFWYWYTVMRTSQRRLKMLEPGTLSILVLDCGLVGFTKSATKMLVERCVVTFFFWKPSRLQIQGFVLFGIIVYPLLFVVITCSMIFTYTVGECTWCSAPPDEEAKTEAEVDNTPKSMATDTTAGEDDDEDAKNQKHTVMVFNEDVEQWIDPAANEIKVTLEPPIPSWIPVAGEITTGHVRSCIPVLQPNGSAISFKTEDQEQVKVKETVNKQQLEQEALKLEKELEAELMSKKHEAKHAANKQKKQEEKELMENIKKRKENHQRDLEAAKTQLKTLGKQYFADEQEYLLHSDNWSSNFDDRLWVRDTKKEDEGKGFWLESKNGSEMTLAKLQSLPPQQQKDHFPLKITWKLYKLSSITEDKEGPSGRPSWFPEVEPKKDDLDEAFQYNVVRIGELLEDWGSRKDREDSEKLDKEEAFAIKSFLEGNIRREKRLLKYNIMKVAAHKGSLVPQEPFRMLGAPKSDTKEETIEDHKTKWWFDSEEEEAWETDIARKAHLEYTPDWQTQLKQLLKDRNISESSEGDAYVVKNAQDKEVKTANLASASEDKKRENFPLRINFQRIKLAKMAQEKGAQTGSDKPPLTFWLDQFKENQHYIANASGQRLVYMGDSTSFFGWMKMGFGAQAGECEWMDEPEEGWDGFDKMLDQEGVSDESEGRLVRLGIHNPLIKEFTGAHMELACSLSGGWMASMASHSAGHAPYDLAARDRRGEPGPSGLIRFRPTAVAQRDLSLLDSCLMNGVKDGIDGPCWALGDAPLCTPSMFVLRRKQCAVGTDWKRFDQRVHPGPGNVVGGQIQQARLRRRPNGGPLTSYANQLGVWVAGHHPGSPEKMDLKTRPSEFEKG